MDGHSHTTPARTPQPGDGCAARPSWISDAIAACLPAWRNLYRAVVRRLTSSELDAPEVGRAGQFEMPTGWLKRQGVTWPLSSRREYGSRISRCQPPRPELPRHQPPRYHAWQADEPGERRPPSVTVEIPVISSTHLRTAPLLPKEPIQSLILDWPATRIVPAPTATIVHTTRQRRRASRRSTRRLPIHRPCSSELRPRRFTAP